jgi:hypothetical protein
MTASFNGALQTVDDVDWFTFDVSADCGGAIPRVYVQSVPGPPAETVCAVFECTGDTFGTIPFCTVGDDYMHPNGLRGCCGSDEVVFQADCAPGSGVHTFTVYFAMQDAPAVCFDYEGDYRVLPN